METLLSAGHPWVAIWHLGVLHLKHTLREITVQRVCREIETMIVNVCRKRPRGRAGDWMGSENRNQENLGHYFIVTFCSLIFESDLLTSRLPSGEMASPTETEYLQKHFCVNGQAE